MTKSSQIRELQHDETLTYLEPGDLELAQQGVGRGLGIEAFVERAVGEGLVGLGRCKCHRSRGGDPGVGVDEDLEAIAEQTDA